MNGGLRDVPGRLSRVAGYEVRPAASLSRRRLSPKRPIPTIAGASRAAKQRARTKPEYSADCGLRPAERLYGAACRRCGRFRSWHTSLNSHTAFTTKPMCLTAR